MAGLQLSRKPALWSPGPSLLSFLTLVLSSFFFPLYTIGRFGHSINPHNSSNRHLNSTSDSKHSNPLAVKTLDDISATRRYASCSNYQSTIYYLDSCAIFINKTSIFLCSKSAGLVKQLSLVCQASPRSRAATKRECFTLEYSTTRTLLPHTFPVWIIFHKVPILPHKKRWSDQGNSDGSGADRIIDQQLSTSRKGYHRGSYGSECLYWEICLLLAFQGIYHQSESEGFWIKLVWNALESSTSKTPRACTVWTPFQGLVASEWRPRLVN